MDIPLVFVTIYLHFKVSSLTYSTNNSNKSYYNHFQTSYINE